jgi:hypothetical protein
MSLLKWMMDVKRQFRVITESSLDERLELYHTSHGSSQQPIS